jgi:hypothetical protein
MNTYKNPQGVPPPWSSKFAAQTTYQPFCGPICGPSWNPWEAFVKSLLPEPTHRSLAKIKPKPLNQM